MSTTRRSARETAFQFLYGMLPLPAAGGNTKECIFSHAEFASFCQSFEKNDDTFAWELVDGTGKKLPAIDLEIHSHSTNWRIERMPLVDLTALRLATFEIVFHPDIPKTVAINEAIELAKKYGAEDSPAFVNGLLDKLEKKLIE